MLAPIQSSPGSLSSFGFAFEVVSAIAIVFLAYAAIASGRWALVERKRALAEHLHILERMRKLHRELLFRDALIHALPDSVIVWTRQKGEVLSYQGASQLLEICLAGPDAAVLAAAIDNLLTRGETFSLEVRTAGKRSFGVHGRPLGDRAVVCVRAKQRALTLAEDPPSEDLGSDIANDDISARIPGDPAHSEASEHNGMIVMGRDGRLKKFNRTFAEFMSLPESELGNQPHFGHLASLVAGTEGHENIWATISAAVCSAEPERYTGWGAETVSDGRSLWLSFERLSNGGTLVIFREDPRSRVSMAA